MELIDLSTIKPDWDLTEEEQKPPSAPPHLPSTPEKITPTRELQEPASSTDANALTGFAPETPVGVVAGSAARSRAVKWCTFDPNLVRPLLRAKWVTWSAIAAVGFAAGYLIGQRPQEREARAQISANPRPAILEPASLQSTSAASPTSAISTGSSASTIQPATVEGQLIITSDPSRAHVTVNGIARGATPLRVQYLPVGSYTVRFVLDGHPIQERRVIVTRDNPRVRINATFRQVSVARRADVRAR